MRSKVWLLALTVALVAFLPVALAGNGDGNSGSGNGNGGPRPTPGLDPSIVTSLGAAGYMGYRYLRFGKNKP